MNTLATLRERGTALLGSLLALVLGIAILTASALIQLTGGTPVPERYAGTPVLLHSAHGTDRDGEFAEPVPWSPERTGQLVRELAAIPGVREVVADRPFYAQAVSGGRPVGGRDGDERMGRGWSSTTLAPAPLVAGHAPRRADEIAVDAELGPRPGESITVLTASGPAAYTVSGTVRGPGYYVTDERARELAPGVRVLGVQLTDGADPRAVAAAARALARTDARVLTGADRRDLAPASARRTSWIGAQVIITMAGLAGFVTILVVAGTFAFGVNTRRRELALLRVIGADPGQVRRALYAEALLLGALGSATGVLIGVLGAPAVTGMLVDTGFEPAGFTIRVRTWIPAAVFVVGVGTALVAVWSASRRAARIDPLEALREAVVDERPIGRVRRIAGIASVALGGGCALASAFAAPTEMITWALATAVASISGATLLAPVFVAPLARALTRPFARRVGAGALLVRESACAAVGRTASTVAPVLATIAFVVLITGNTRTGAEAFADHASATTRASGAVVASGTPGLSDAAVAGVTGSAQLASTVYAGPARLAVDAAGIDPHAFARTHDRLDPVRGTLADLVGPDTVAVTASTLAALGQPPSQEAEFTFADGRTRVLRIVAVLDDRADSHGVLLARDTLRAHDPDALTEVVHRTGGPAIVPGDPAATALGVREIGVAAYARRADAEEDRLIDVFTLLLVATTAGYTALAVGNTLLMAGACRVADFRVLRLSGATRRQVLWTVAGETTFVVVLGVLLGGLVAVPSLLGIRAGLAGALGTPVRLVVPWAPVTCAIVTCLAIALAASVLPARRAMRGVAP
ncbi:FtsX-like permease family protein [Embleya sp. NPDC127516]|uniref:ABC transporter permease n=1 Tax=Embleya sp. NPDC127516 TaxID=3363990 RepID=UPI0037FB1759